MLNNTCNYPYFYINFVILALEYFKERYLGERLQFL